MASLLEARGNIGRDPAALAERDTLLFSPTADIAAALTAGRRPHRPTRSSTCPASVLDERLELRPESRGILGAQVNLVLSAAESELNCLLRRPAVKIVLQRDDSSSCHPNPRHGDDQI